MTQRSKSLRGAAAEPTLIQVQIAHMQQDFDFAFPASPLGTPAKRHEPASAEQVRPTTAGNDFHAPKRISASTIMLERPKTSSSAMHSKPQDAQIGLALGSPRHPPQLIDDSLSQMSRGSRNAFLEGPLCHSTKAKKWKLGGLFRGKTSNKEATVFYRVQHDPSDNRKLGLPIQRTPWRNPKSPAVSQGDFDGQFATEEVPDVPDLYTTHHTAPAIQVSIPITPLDRFSVMFKDVNGEKQPNLMTRRDKDLGTLTLTTNDNLDVPGLVRRNTSPTLPRHPEISRTPIKYSIFPSTPTTLRVITTDSPRSTHVRNATAPAQLRPLNVNFGGFSLPPPEPEATPRASSQLERSDISNPTTAAPSPSAKTEKTRESTHSEIYFDIVSYRGSQAQSVQQFEMMRPPSAAIELIRSKSNGRKLQELATSRSAVDADNRAEKTTSAEIDEAIAVVEELTATSNSPAKEPGKQESQETVNTRRVQPQELDGLQRLSEIQEQSRIRKPSSSFKIKELNIQVPSPVMEQSEESTPNPMVPIASALSISPPAQVRADTSPKPPPKPPAVPIKDSKFIPLSKYAPRKTTEDLVRQTGLRPVRASRSNTDTLAAYNRPQRQTPERSSTMPLPERNQSPRSKHSTTPSSSRAYSKQQSKSTTASSPLAIQIVKPAAEVSVARTVSLSRSPSALLVGSKFPKRSTSRAGAPQPVLARTISKRDPPSDDITEKKVLLGVPVFEQVHRKHRPGRSMDAAVETTNAPTTSPPPVPMTGPAIFM